MQLYWAILESAATFVPFNRVLPCWVIPSCRYTCCIACGRIREVLGLMWPSPKGRTVKTRQEFYPWTCHSPSGQAPTCSAGFLAQCKTIQVGLYWCWTNNAIKLSYICSAQFLTSVIFMVCFWFDARIRGSSTKKRSAAKRTSGIYEQCLLLCDILMTCCALNSCGFVLQGIWSRKTVENCQSDPVSELWNCMLVYGKAPTRDVQR